MVTNEILANLWISVQQRSDTWYEELTGYQHHSVQRSEVGIIIQGTKA
jgi:hypothetical protein